MKSKRVYVLEMEEGLKAKLEKYFEEKDIYVVYANVVPSGYFAELNIVKFKPRGERQNGN